MMCDSYTLVSLFDNGTRGGGGGGLTIVLKNLTIATQSLYVNFHSSLSKCIPFACELRGSYDGINLNDEEFISH